MITKNFPQNLHLRLSKALPVYLISSGILFVSLEKVFILALEGTRFPSLLTPQTLTQMVLAILEL